MQLYNKKFGLKARPEDIKLDYVVGIDENERETLKRVITRSISAGDTYSQLGQNIRKTCQKLDYETTETIAITEMGRVQELTYKQSGKKMGYKYKRFMVQPDEFVCTICNGNDTTSEVRPGKVFPIDVDVIPDKTHPRCRCYTNYVDELDLSPEDLL